jgi:hypothetical protein
MHIDWKGKLDIYRFSFWHSALPRTDQMIENLADQSVYVTKEKYFVSTLEAINYFLFLYS